MGLTMRAAGAACWARAESEKTARLANTHKGNGRGLIMMGGPGTFLEADPQGSELLWRAAGTGEEAEQAGMNCTNWKTQLSYDGNLGLKRRGKNERSQDRNGS